MTDGLPGTIFRARSSLRGGPSHENNDRHPGRRDRRVRRSGVLRAADRSSRAAASAGALRRADRAGLRPGRGQVRGHLRRPARHPGKARAAPPARHRSHRLPRGRAARGGPGIHDRFPPISSARSSRPDTSPAPSPTAAG
ncbi:MAG: hypothetical protein M0C28_35325 [Candidatus Moduliflexus flocculans]|nr:hypothetical protein [Candidatus Moduliflexus flocculans]